MISDRGIDALRLGATLAHTLPLRLQLRCGPHVALEVSRPPVESSAGAEWMSPCEFRGAVANAWTLHREGRAIGMRGLPHDDPAVDVVVPSGGRALRGGIYRLPWKNALMHVFATTAPLDMCRAVADPAGIDVHADEMLGTALVYLATRGPARDAIEVLEVLLARLTMEALVEDVARLTAMTGGDPD